MDASQKTSWVTILIRLAGCVMISVGIMLLFAGAFSSAGTGSMCLAGVLVVGFAAALLAANPRKPVGLPTPTAIASPECQPTESLPPEYHRGINDPETPLVLTFLNDIGLPLLCGVAAMYGLTLGGSVSFLTSVCIGPVFIWLVIRMVNRRSDPRRIKSSNSIPEGDEPPETE